MKQFRFLILALGILLPVISCSYEPDPEVPGEVSTEALEFVLAMGLGVNIGNTFDSLSTSSIAGETGWGNPVVTQDFIQSLKTHGYKSVRLPVSWVDYMGAAPDYTIGETWMARVEEVVNWILDEDMYCILNLHHDGGSEIDGQGNINAKYWIKQISLPEKEDEINSRFAKVWEQIAERFKDASELLILESMNEVGFDNLWNRYAGGQAEEKAEAYRLLNKLNQTFVDTVRATGGNNEDRYLLIAGYWTDIACTIDPAFIMPEDTAENRQIVSVHFYDPYLFTHTEQTTWGAVWDINPVNTRLNSLKKYFLEKGIPVILGEYGVNLRSNGRSTGDPKETESRQKWMLTVTQICLDLGICPVLWDTGLRNNNYGMGDVGRTSPFTISADLQYVFENITYPDD